jgi:hypothetical protein
MAIDYSVLAQPKGNPLAQGWKKRDAQSRLDVANAEVDRRDGLVSRISGKPLLKESADPKLQRDRCHLKGKGAHPELKYEPSNIFTASRYEHRLYDKHAIEVEGTDAYKRLIFRWNRRLVPVGQEPFKLLSKRRSQNRDIAIETLTPLARRAWQDDEGDEA